MSRKKVDFTGQQIGDWKVLKANLVNSKNHKTYKCICKCGIECNVYHTHLKSKKSTKCFKCARQENMGENHYKYSGYGEISGQIFDSIKRGATKSKRKSRKDLDFTINIEYLWNLFIKQDRKCALSGIIIYFPQKYHEKGTASLDRIDNSKGYIEGNVQWVHKDINRMKNIFKQDYFIEMCKKIYKNCEI